jgi:hypothetical protein
MWRFLVGATVLGGIWAPAAQAQVSTVVRPVVAADYNQDRNVSVEERARPDYDALGIRSGGMLILPRLDLGTVVADNVYASPTDRTGDVYFVAAPSVSARSDWSRHALQLSAGGAFRRYANQPVLNREEWNLRALGRLDILDSMSLTGEGQAALIREEPFSSQLSAPLAALSTYRRDFLSTKFERQVGRTRLIATADYTDLRFRPLEFRNGVIQSQADRNRQIVNVQGQGEYALSPGFVVFGQGTYTDINYDRTLLNGNPNRDSGGWRAQAGFNADISAFFRGTLAVGYAQRNYKSPIYANVGGLSAQGELTYFLSRNTDITLELHRQLDDAVIVGNGAFFDSAVALRVNHELFSNVLLEGNVAYQNQDYANSNLSYDIVRVGGHADYLINNRFRVRFSTDYGYRTSPLSTTVGQGLIGSAKIEQFNAGLSLIIQR